MSMMMVDDESKIVFDVFVTSNARYRLLENNNAYLAHKIGWNTKSCRRKSGMIALQSMTIYIKYKNFRFRLKHNCEERLWDFRKQKSGGKM